jgi:hypothetical protein
MPRGTADSQHVTILLEEYKELGAENRLRINLQQSNMNVLIVLVTAVTGYLATYVTDHGLNSGRTSLVLSPVVTLVVLTPVVINIFLWRHLDHDVNIIDKAGYMNSVLRPELTKITGGEPVLAFEVYLHHRRKSRPRKLGPFLAFGQDHVPMFILAGAYLAFGWYIRLAVSGHAGEFQTTFDYMLYAGTLLTIVSITMGNAVGREYNTVGAEALAAGPDTQQNAVGGRHITSLAMNELKSWMHLDKRQAPTPEVTDGSPPSSSPPSRGRGRKP